MRPRRIDLLTAACAALRKDAVDRNSRLLLRSQVVAEFRVLQPRDSWITFALVAAAAGLVVVADLLFPRMGTGLFLVLVLIAVLLLLHWMARAWGYRCPECGELFRLTILGQFTALNWGDERSVRCPHCGKRNWVKILRKAG